MTEKKGLSRRNRSANRGGLMKSSSFDDLFNEMESTMNRTFGEVFGRMQTQFDRMLDMVPWNPLEGVDLTDGLDERTSTDSKGFSISKWFTKGSKFPTVDVSSDEENIYIEAALAGYKKEDVNIELTDDGILLEAESKETEEDEGKNYHFKKMIGNAFRKFVSIPEKIDREKILAKMGENSVLKITIPKIKVELEERDNKIEIE